MRLIDLFLALIGAVVLAGGALVFLNPPTEPPETDTPAPRLPLVEVASAALSDRRASVVQTALLRPAAEIVVTTEGTGRVVAVAPGFVLGGRLGKGAEIFRLEDARLRNDLARAEADIAATLAERDRLQADFARIDALVERNVSTASALDETQALLIAAEARLAQAEAARRTAQLTLDETVVRAPFDAVVTAEAISVGQFLQPGTEVGRLVLAERADLLLRLGVDQLQAVEKAGPLTGQTVSVRAADGSGAVKPGLIQRVAFTTEVATQTVGVIVTVADPFSPEGGVFRIGTLYEVEVAIPDRAALIAVPVEAIQTGNRVWAVEDGALREVDAVIDRRAGDVALLRTSDLAPGTPVLLTRLPNAIEGLRVRMAVGG
ncbi:MAG: efflux RND transporter periplasmic adaptor subunit [Pseudomonadota bacterium]